MNAPSKTVRRAHVGRGMAHDSAVKHVTGEARYVDDLPDLPATVHAAVVTSPVAHGRLDGIDTDDANRMPGVVCVVQAADIPGHNDVGPILNGEPVFATGLVEHVGQIVAAVAADSIEQATAAARAVRLSIEPFEPILTPEAAHEQQRYVLPTQTIEHGDVDAARVAAAHTFEGTLNIGGQEHFYLEGQVALAVPGEDADLIIYSSTQHPTEVQHHIAKILGLAAHDVEVIVRRMGGAFGGKESQATLIAAVAAVIAHRTGRPCKLRLRREDDMVVTGKRHDFVARWRAAVESNGRIRGLEVDYLARAGHVADLTGPVIARTLTHTDNAYHLPAARLRGHACKTHTVSNTAFRGFGGPQGMLLTESVIDTVARRLGLEPNVVRAANYYGPQTGTQTPYGQHVTDNRLTDVVNRALEQAQWAERRRRVDHHNASNPVIRRGLAMMPVKFGISFNLPTLNQAGALVHVYMDGSVHLNHGGTEMGQGLFIKVAQVVAEVFQIDIDRIKVTATTTAKVPNTSATAASVGSDLNGMAAYRAAEQIKTRMAEVAARKFGVEPAEVLFVDGRVAAGEHEMPFEALAKLCWAQRVSLSAAGHYATPKLHWDPQRMTGRPFFYYSYGAAVSEVLVDTLTGETRCVAAHLVQDCGSPLNPAIDLGQVEGAFVQGLGWLTCEELWWDDAGRLRTTGPSTYKIPGSRDVPSDFSVTILDDKPNQEETVFRSKAIGEPPLMMAISAWLAIVDAVASIGGGQRPPRLDAPATPERVLLAIEDMKRPPST